MPIPVYFQQYVNEQELQKAQIEVVKTRAKAEIEVQKSTTIAMQKEQIKTARELSGRWIQIAANGEAYVIQQTLFGTSQEKLALKVVNFVKYVQHGKCNDPFILCFSIKNNEKFQEFCLPSTKITPQYVRNLFLRSGIHFGFKQKTEDEIEVLFIEEILNISPFHTLPMQHGWYAENGEWRYAFPDELVWKEVWEYANN